MQSGGGQTRRVDWAQSSALLVRREAAAAVGYLDPDFFVYYDECDFCKRLADAGHPTLFVPAAEAVHHDQLSTDLAAGLPRIVEFHRNRDLYMRKHHSRGRRSPSASSPPGPTPCAPSPPHSCRAGRSASTGPTPGRRSSPPAAKASGTAPPMGLKVGSGLTNRPVGG